MHGVGAYPDHGDLERILVTEFRAYPADWNWSVSYRRELQRVLVIGAGAYPRAEEFSGQ